jgi:hypothetical protein
LGRPKTRLSKPERCEKRKMRNTKHLLRQIRKGIGLELSNSNLLKQLPLQKRHQAQNLPKMIQPRILRKLVNSVVQDLRLRQRHGKFNNNLAFI